jgi:hypothetical protein
MGILQRIYYDFSGLPLAETTAGLIKERQDNFTAAQASEVSQWFRALALHLDAGINDIPLSPVARFRPITPSWGCRNDA